MLINSPLGTLFGTGSRTNPDGSFDLDENGFPQITSSFVVLGDPNPDWRAGLGFNLSYKKLNLNVEKREFKRLLADTRGQFSQKKGLHYFLNQISSKGKASHEFVVRN